VNGLVVVFIRDSRMLRAS